MDQSYIFNDFSSSYGKVQKMQVKTTKRLQIKKKHSQDFKNH